MTPAEARELWVEALRSGLYNQTQGNLARSYLVRSDKPGEYSKLVDRTEYCCLGVACDLALQAGVLTDEPRMTGQVDNEDEPVSGAYGDYFTLTFGDSEETYANNYLPLEVQEWLGLTYRDGQYSIQANEDDEFPDEVHDLAQWNDDGKTFDEIADIIESEPRGFLTQ